MIFFALTFAQGPNGGFVTLAWKAKVWIAPEGPSRY